MNRKELIRELAVKANLTQDQTASFLTAFVDTVTSELIAGRELTVRDLGKFKISNRKSRSGVNPRTGEKLTIPAMKVVTFSASAGLKKAVKNI